jgi:hypothetical protein
VKVFELLKRPTQAWKRAWIHALYDLEINKERKKMTNKTNISTKVLLLSLLLVAMILATGCGSQCVPSLVSPDIGAEMDNGCEDRSDGVVWNFDWSDCPSASAYHLFVQGSNASIPVIDDITTESSFRHESPGSFIINKHLLGWKWKVRAKVNDTWGDWTAEQSFDVESINTDCP